MNRQRFIPCGTTHGFTSRNQLAGPSHKSSMRCEEYLEKSWTPSCSRRPARGSQIQGTRICNIERYTTGGRDASFLLLESRLQRVPRHDPVGCSRPGPRRRWSRRWRTWRWRAHGWRRWIPRWRGWRISRRGRRISWRRRWLSRPQSLLQCSSHGGSALLCRAPKQLLRLAELRRASEL